MTSVEGGLVPHSSLVVDPTDEDEHTQYALTTVNTVANELVDVLNDHIAIELEDIEAVWVKLVELEARIVALEPP